MYPILHLFLVEVRGIEPLSKNLLIQLSPGAVYHLNFSLKAPTNRLFEEATVLCVIGSMAKHRCTFTAYLTLSPRPRYSSEERAALGRGTALRQPVQRYR